MADSTHSERDRALVGEPSVTYGAGSITVLRRLPCPSPGCGCRYGDEAVLRMGPERARALAADLERCARYAERDGVL